MPSRQSPKLGRAAASLVLLAALATAGCQTNAWQGTTPPGSMMSAPASTILANDSAPFAVGLVPMQAPPVRIGTAVSFQLASSAAGFAHLYLINASGNVLVLAENLPVGADQPTVYPGLTDGVNLRASPPAGTERVVLLVTRQPLSGFSGSGGAAVTRPQMLATGADAFIARLNATTAALADTVWAVTETRLQIIS